MWCVRLKSHFTHCSEVVCHTSAPNDPHPPFTLPTSAGSRLRQSSEGQRIQTGEDSDRTDGSVYFSSQPRLSTNSKAATLP